MSGEQTAKECWPSWSRLRLLIFTNGWLDVSPDIISMVKGLTIWRLVFKGGVFTFKLKQSRPQLLPGSRPPLDSLISSIWRALYKMSMSEEPDQSCLSMEVILSCYHSVCGHWGLKAPDIHSWCHPDLASHQSSICSHVTFGIGIWSRSCT